MINSNFTSYLQLLWQSHIRQAVPWARDNLVWGILVLLLPPITALSIFKRKIDWPPLWASVAFYAVALCIYVGVYFVRAAWKMDVQRQLEIRNQTLAFEQIVRGKDEEYRSVVRMKDGEFAAAMGEKAAEIEQLKRSVGYNDWKELADRFKSIDPHVEVQCQQTGEDHVARYRWEIRGRTLAESNECIVLCSLAGAMLLKSRKVSHNLSDAVRRENSDSDRWLMLLKESGTIGDWSYFSETLKEGTVLPHFLGRIRSLSSASAQACIQCARVEL